ncbi:SUEL-type lectin domain-containing protein, partial [Staphylococcus aureus]|uniref:SUEL-type lectin domain-containing protein n=1 Tax=Staphylococcus aureus TaxID=1280 RepID=UPI001E527313
IPTILGAVYGRANVSDQVRAKVANGCLQIKASNHVFGDSFPNVQKSLVVVYQFGNAPPQVGIAKEHETL